MINPAAKFDIEVFEAYTFFAGITRYAQFQRFAWYSAPFSVSSCLTFFLMLSLPINLVYGLIFFTLLVVASFCTLLLINKLTFARLKYLQGRTLFLSHFFNMISGDLDSQVDVEGLLNCKFYTNGSVYERQPGLKRYEFTWGKISFTLQNGVNVKMTLIDKVQEQYGYMPVLLTRRVAVVMDEAESYENLLYETYIDKFKVHKGKFNVPLTRSYLLEEAVGLASNLYDSMKPALSKAPIKKKPKQKKSKAVTKPLSSDNHAIYLKQSSLTLRSSKVDEFSYVVRYLGKKIDLKIQTVKGNVFSLVSIPMPHLDVKEAQTFLKMNPSLVYARFAYDGEQILLLKSMLYDTLDQEELDTAINGVSKLATLFQSVKDIQKRIKKSKHERNKDKELALLNLALTKIKSNIKEVDDNYTVTIVLPSERTQTINVYFDRQDINGEPIIYVSTKCGLYDETYNPELLKKNAQPGYGAMGIQRVGGKEHFVITDCQLAATADPLELSGLILNLASKGNNLEKKLNA